MLYILLLLINYKLQEFCPIPPSWVREVGHEYGRSGTHLKIKEFIMRKVHIKRKTRLCSTGPTNQLWWLQFHDNFCFFYHAIVILLRKIKISLHVLSHKFHIVVFSIIVNTLHPLQHSKQLTVWCGIWQAQINFPLCLVCLIPPFFRVSHSSLYTLLLKNNLSHKPCWF